jgi:hypothetical protein
MRGRRHRPTAGTLTVNLTTPNSGLDGAAIVVLSAPTPPGSVTAAAGLTLWGGPVTAANATIALTGTLSAGPILTLQVTTRRWVSTAHVLQVAMRRHLHPPAASPHGVFAHGYQVINCGTRGVWDGGWSSQARFPAAQQGAEMEIGAMQQPHSRFALFTPC